MTDSDWLRAAILYRDTLTWSCSDWLRAGGGLIMAVVRRTYSYRSDQVQVQGPWRMYVHCTGRLVKQAGSLWSRDLLSRDLPSRGVLSQFQNISAQT